MEDRPLFVPLKAQWFHAFASGEKTAEWRRYGPQWNEKHCRPGRRVVLSLGYTRNRIYGHIVSFEIKPASGPATELYGEHTPCAVFEVVLD